MTVTVTTGGPWAQRFVICHNPEQADRDAAVWANYVAHLTQLIADSDIGTARCRPRWPYSTSFYEAAARGPVAG